VTLSLPQTLYLLAYDQNRRRMTHPVYFGLTLRAGALAELLMTGHLRDHGGQARAQGAAAFDDPLLDVVYQEIAASLPHRWQHWVNRHDRQAVRMVRERLAADGVVRLDRARRLGMFPYTRVTVQDPALVAELAERVRATLNGAHRDGRDAALVALAARAELGTVLPRKVRVQHKQRIDQLAETTGPVAQALRKAISARREHHRAASPQREHEQQHQREGHDAGGEDRPHARGGRGLRVEHERTAEARSRGQSDEQRAVRAPCRVLIAAGKRAA